MTRNRELALCALLFSVLVVPAVAMAQEGPLATNTDAPRFSIEARRDSVVALARQQIGRRYVFGGTSPTRGFDCSGFTQYLARTFGVNLPRTAAQQARRLNRNCGPNTATNASACVRSCVENG